MSRKPASGDVDPMRSRLEEKSGEQGSKTMKQHEESPVDLSLMDQHQKDTQRPFCLSQPELDTSGTFDIPAPPPVTSDLSHSTFWVRPNTQSDPQNHLTTCNKETLRGPAASVLELQLDGSAEDMENVSVHESALSGGTQMAPRGSGLPSKPAREDDPPHHHHLLSHDSAHIKLTISPPDRTSCFSELQVPTRAVLARQVTTSSSSSPSDRMIPPKDPEFGTNTESSPEPPTQPDDRPLSLTYASVGSDEGSMMEVYFSALEDSKEEEEGRFTGGETFVSGGGKDLRGGHTQEGRRQVRGFPLKTNMEKTEGGGQSSEDQLLLKENSHLVWGRNLTSPEKRQTTAAPEEEEEEEEELLAPQVLQANMLMECDSALPSSDTEGEGNQELRPPRLQDQFLVPIEGPAVRASTWKEEVQRLVCADTFGAGGVTPDAALCSREGVGPMTQKAKGNTETQQQVRVESSAQNTDGEATGLRPAEDHSCRPPSAAAWVQPADTMSSAYSSTKLTLKSSSSAIQEEPRARFHKVSLLKEADSSLDLGSGSSELGSGSSGLGSGSSGLGSGSSELGSGSSGLGSGSSGLGSGSFDLGSEYRWKNRFVGVTQYKPQKISLSSDSASSADTHLGSSSVAPGRSLSHSTGHLIQNGGAEEWRRSLVEEVQLAVRTGEEEEQTEGESQWESQHLSCSNLDNTDSSSFTGVFKATLVDLNSDPVPPLTSDPAPPPSTPPSSPDADSPIHNDMDSLVDTLRSMGPSLRPKSTSLRPPPPVLVSSLPPIVEDAPNPVIISVLPPPSSHTKGSEEAQNGLYTLPAELGLKRSSPRDTRSPLDLMKKNQDLTSPKLNRPDPSSPTSGSRLNSSVIFSSYRSSSSEKALENGTTHKTLFRSGSLPEIGSSAEPTIVRLKEPGEVGASPEPAQSRLERLSFLLNSSSSGSLNGAEESCSSRISRPPSLGFSPPPSITSPTHLLSPAGSIDLHRPASISEPPLSSMFNQGPRTLQRSLSCEERSPVSQFSSMHGGPQFNCVQGGGQFQLLESPFQDKRAESDQSLLSKYKAFPDAYLTKEKEHGKLNPRPGKMFIFDRAGMTGQRIELRGDVIDATPWELQETISIRVLRGGWVLYEKPNFKGEKVALDEGDIELTCPFSSPEEAEPNEQGQDKPTRRFIIGSVRRAVRDYSVPEISLFPEENAEGKKVVFRDTSEDARIFGFPIKANSIIVNAGLWLVFSQPFFQGVPRILEVGGYSSPAAWGVEQPYVASLHPLKVGEPRVENLSESKVLIYEKPYFTGKSRTVSSNMKDFMSRTNQQQAVLMYSVGSLKVLGGIWVGYEKENFRGHQYLLEEGEYHDWRVWGGCNSELRSIRIIRADLSDPLMVMFEQPEEQQGVTEENTFEVTEAIPDVELFGFKTFTHSIHVLSGAWVAYSHVDFSGSQYILEKGFYNNCADWGSQDMRICSIQPILLAPTDNSSSSPEIILYSEPDFQGEQLVFYQNQAVLLDRFITRSCRVVRGSWVLYESKQFSGNMYVLSEDDYPSLPSMGCPSSCSIGSVKLVPLMFSVPSISLFSLEGLEGREITSESEVISLLQEGFNNHVLSVRVHSGCWVLCEHSTYRGRQFLLEPIELTNWPKFSSLHTIGSMFPVRQKRHFFRVRNKESGHFLSVQGGVEEMKSGRVVVTREVEPLSDIWFYQDGLIKNKLSSTMCLQVMGNVEPAAKVVLWNETRQPIQTWSAQMTGLISSLTFSGMVLDVKGGRTYDREHVVVMPEMDETPSQQWDIELL
ncbi:beta/gamma crystallin domain-containing protein 1 [Nematolebias whitei]|uniref:beta/gamma crystallin domain-containing protein 1 n=1 Tax=Nematolebias whitei TaxID=451745 RepID=UPI001897392D|nr:beta/gamma crystallin domain-containing protein 1 [Nematolebias whitei]